MINLEKNKYLLTLIDQIERRPQMFVGKKSISLIDIYIMAYNNGLRADDKSHLNDNLIRNFSCWIASKYNKSASLRWAEIILGEVPDEEKACDRFSIEFSEYINDIRDLKTTDELFKCLKSRFRDLEETDNQNIFLEVDYYPNKYASTPYGKYYYWVGIYYGASYEGMRCRKEWKIFYIDMDLKDILVDSQFNKDVKIRIEEFLESDGYKKFTIKDIPRNYQNEVFLKP